MLFDRLFAGCGPLAATVSIIAMAAGAPVHAAQSTDEASSGDIIVTAQKRAEALQDVPIAVSAFSQEALETQRIDNGQNLQFAIPNVTQARQQFNAYNFQIRGIGTKVTSSSADSATGMHINNAPITAFGPAFSTEYYDVERVEVLRGPQGTLYGRNAPGGVVNIITAKPDLGEFSGSIMGELGNHNSRKLRGVVNIPLGDTAALRFAGLSLTRSGFAYNPVTDNDIDGRDLWALRSTLLWEPASNFRATAMWEHFYENSTRARTGATLCAADTGPEAIGAQSTGADVPGNLVRNMFARGCRNVGINASNRDAPTTYIFSTRFIVAPAVAAALGQPVLNAAGQPILPGLYASNVNAGLRGGDDLRTFPLFRDPKYQSRNDFVSLNLEWDVIPSITLSSLTSFNGNRDVSYQPSDPTIAGGPFEVTAVTPGGFFADPQLGSANRLLTMAAIRQQSRQWTQELRAQSDFDGPVNFNLGGFYLDYKTRPQDVFGFQNIISAYQALANSIAGRQVYFIDPVADPIAEGGDYSALGNNYQDTRALYRLKSKAVFGELYWNVTDDLKITGGLRYTDETKTNVLLPLRLYRPDLPPSIPLGGPTQRVRYKEVTGRLGFDWKTRLPFTDDTLIYAFYSRGYKGGGFNPAPASGVAAERALTPASFDPEYINSFEIGAKNTLLQGDLIVNLTGFIYDYKGYQIARTLYSTPINDNVDASVKGLEFESILKPFSGVRLNANAGYLSTKIRNGLIVDAYDPTQGDPALTAVRSASGTPCVVPTAQVESFLATLNSGAAVTIPGGAGEASRAASTRPLNAYDLLLTACSGLRPYVGAPAFTPIRFEGDNGVPVNLRGKKLPNAPELTFSFGAQYAFDVGADWETTLRGDYYYQTKSYSRAFNSPGDRIDGWSNVNISLSATNRDLGLTVQAYVKNLLGDNNIIDNFTADPIFRTRVVAISEPRVMGLSLTKTW